MQKRIVLKIDGIICESKIVRQLYSIRIIFLIYNSNYYYVTYYKTNIKYFIQAKTRLFNEITGYAITQPLSCFIFTYISNILK